MSGERCAHRLLALIMTLKIRQAGGACEEGDILQILSDIDRGLGGWGQAGNWGRSQGGVTFTMGEPSVGGIRPIVALVGTEWSIHLHAEPDGAGGVVTCLLKDPGQAGGRRSLVHDLPEGSAGRTTVSTGADFTVAGQRVVPIAHVSGELHHSHGLLWDPTADCAADIRYHQDGSIKWKRRYRGGRMMGRGDGTPAHESYWPGGRLQAEEYGSANFGRHRDPAAGPAYAEYHPNGQKALEVFARRGADGRVSIVGSGVWDSRGNKREPSDREARTLSDTGLAMAAEGIDIDHFFEGRRKERAAAEAVEAVAAGIAASGHPNIPPGGPALPRPSGMRQAGRGKATGAARAGREAA